MVTIQTRARVRDDGRLALDVATELVGETVDVLLVLQPVPANGPPTVPKDWPEGFIERTYGSCADDPIELLPPPPPDLPRDPIE